MTIKFEDLTADDELTRGDEVHIRSTYEGGWYSGKFINDNAEGVAIFSDGALKFYPWANVVVMYKEIER